MIWNTLVIALKQMGATDALVSYRAGRCDWRFGGDHDGYSGNGATKAVSDQISSLGSNLLIVMPGQRFGARRAGASAPAFKLSDADAIRSQITGLKAVAPTASESVTVVSAGKNWTTTVTGSTDDYFKAGSWRLSSGRTFTETEERAGKAVCILGETVRREAVRNAGPCRQ